MMMLTTVYVPNVDYDRELGILPGSGIVGTPLSERAPSREPYQRRYMEAGGREGRQRVDPDMLVIDYEGNKFGWDQFKRYANRVFHAYDRHTWNLSPDRPLGGGYPTIARMVAPRDALLPIGQWDPDARRVIVHDSEKLEAWIGDYTDDDLIVNAP